MREVAWPIAAGFVLGILFYGGLWWTVSRAAGFDRPAFALLGSAVLRTAAVLGGIHMVGGGQWSRILLCMLGLMVARLAVTWVTRLPPARETAGARHAP